MRRSILPAVPMVTLALLALAGCASEPAASGATLADAKALVQLVRIETEERLPAADVVAVETVGDTSEACLPENEDAEGLQRRWVTSASVELTATGEEGIGASFQTLIDSFTANGWSEVEYGGGGVVTLSRPGSDASIDFVASLGEDGAPSTITADIRSGCVATDGADSDEVAQLEDSTGATD